MSLSPRNPEGNSASGGSHPIAWGFGSLVLLALIVLFAIRHLFGGVDIRAGLKG